MVDSKQIVVAPDKFKDSLSAPEVCSIIRSGLRDALDGDWRIETAPMADGGEGTVESLVEAMDGEIVASEVRGPRNAAVEARWGWIPGHGDRPDVAVIEMAQASGIELLEEDRKNPMKTTTFGTGELIENAVDRGANRVILGIGGSATVDGGVGAARALGFEVLDESGNEVEGGGGCLDRVSTIRDDRVSPAVKTCDIDIACDVDNPLLGENGAARVYGPQKGATPEMVETLESNLANWANVVEDYRGKSFRDTEGTGAAGGLGFGLVGLLDAELTSGADLVMDVMDLNSTLRSADVLITGEGKIDRQTTHGKTPHAVAKRAREMDVTFTVGMAGTLGSGYEACFDPFDWLMALPVGPTTLEQSIEDAPEQLKRRSQDLANLLERVVNGQDT